MLSVCVRQKTKESFLLSFLSVEGGGKGWAERRVVELEAELAESLTIQNKEVNNI